MYQSDSDSPSDFCHDIYVHVQHVLWLLYSVHMSPEERLHHL